MFCLFIAVYMAYYSFSRKQYSVLIFPVAFSLLAYLNNYFYTVKYDKDAVIIENVLSTRRYTVDQLIDIKTAYPLVRVFKIRFSDGKEYLFLKGSPRSLHDYNQEPEANKMEQDLRVYMTTSL